MFVQFVNNSKAKIRWFIEIKKAPNRNEHLGGRSVFRQNIFRTRTKELKGFKGEGIKRSLLLTLSGQKKEGRSSYSFIVSEWRTTEKDKKTKTVILEVHGWPRSTEEVLFTYTA